MPDRKFRILCVDDHEDTCLMLSTLFGQMGYEVESSPDPEDALARARNGRFDLYILDGHFRGSQGADLCDALIESEPHARVVFYSGDAQESARESALGAGASAYVTKPDIKALVAAVEKVLNAKVDTEQTTN
jgi:CheY-like chemotaxis protein